MKGLKKKYFRFVQIRVIRTHTCAHLCLKSNTHTHTHTHTVSKYISHTVQFRKE